MSFLKRQSKDHVTFSVKLDELRSLMQCRGHEAYIKVLCEYGNVEKLCRDLNSSPIEGVVGTPTDLDSRRNYFGANVIPSKGAKSFFRQLMVTLSDVILIILIVAAIISIGISFVHVEGEEQHNKAEAEEEGTDELSLEWIEGTAMLLTVLVVMLVTAIQNYTKEHQYKKLQNKIHDEHKISVIRSGQTRLVPVSELVVGDVCQIKYGDTLPADGLLLQNNDLKVDESSLTGETDLVKKGISYRDISLWSGTHIMEGSGRMVVTAVGLNSQTGIIMTLLGATKSEKSEKTFRITSQDSIGDGKCSRTIETP